MSRPRAQMPDETDERGAFVRQTSRFQDWVTADGASGYPAAAGRYHLYVSLACPWASRVVIARALKGLEGVIGMTVVDPIRDERGWAFTDRPGCGPDPINGFRFLREAYLASDPGFEGRVTVPALWDRERKRFVNNESSQLLIMLNEAFDAYAERPEVDLYPAPLRARIDEVDAEVYEHVNDGVYRAGFASSQAAYEQAFDALFEALDRLERRLSGSRFLVSDERPTTADWRLFTTLVRFDAVYVLHFKCNLRRLIDYPNLWAYTRDLFQQPRIAETVDMEHIKLHYYRTHPQLNPLGLVPKGPALDFWTPHERG